MKTQQKVLFFVFLLTNTLRIAMTCFGLHLVIKIVGANQLGFYFGYAAMISIVAILFLTFISKSVPTLHRYIGLHVVFIIAAIIALTVSKGSLQAQLVFLSVMGLEILVYFNNWSVAARLITPFESKRLYPLLGTATEIGIFAGSLIAIAAHLGMTRTHYFLFWLIGEIVAVAAGFYLIILSRNLARQEHAPPVKERPISLSRLLRQYQLIPKIAIWVLLWGLLMHALMTLTGATFDRSGINLTALYGTLILATALVSIFFSYKVFPKAVKWLRLGTILLASSLIILVVGGSYLVFDVFILAIVAFMIFELTHESFITLAISTEFGLYPTTHRDRLRLLAEILATSTGTACVGLVFLAPDHWIRWIIGGLFILFVILGYLSRQGFAKEVLQFLRGKDKEEQDNAIALFDMLELKEGYDKVLSLLVYSKDLTVRIHVLETFASLGTTKPAARIFDLLHTTDIDPLKIAILRYVDNIEFDKLDPFLEYRLLDELKRICSSHPSNILRSLAVKLMVQNGPLDSTIAFITKSLKDKDDRIVANAIEGLNYVDYPGVITLLRPFLESRVPRTRANCIIALWKYADIRKDVIHSLDNMLQSRNVGEMISGIYVVGEVGNKKRIHYLKDRLSTPQKDIHRGAAIALLKLGEEEACDTVVQMILGKDEKQAINVCYLSLRIEERILNELIIARICELGKKQRELAYRRYASCGGFCRDQLKLLAGKKTTIHPL